METNGKFTHLPSTQPHNQLHAPPQGKSISCFIVSVSRILPFQKLSLLIWEYTSYVEGKALLLREDFTVDRLCGEPHPSIYVSTFCGSEIGSWGEGCSVWAGNQPLRLRICLLGGGGGTQVSCGRSVDKFQLHNPTCVEYDFLQG